jgi:glycosyltransferase involved in cell wall biosynthesis
LKKPGISFMKIGIDAREIQDGITTGMGRALAVFLDYFSALNDRNMCILFSGNPVPEGCFSPSPRIRNIVRKENNMWLWDQFVLYGLIKNTRIDLFYSPYYKLPLLCPCPAVNAIFDLMYVYCELYKKELDLLSLLYLKTFGRLMAHKTGAIFTCSEYSKTEIIKFHGVKPEKITVIYLGLDEIYTPVRDPERIAETKKNYSIDSDFILYTGNFKPHKNVETLIRAFEKVLKIFPDITLVLAGAPIVSAEKIEKCIQSSPASSSIIVTGKIPIEDQVVLYSSAVVFVMPSLYEGFGYPPLEAMACGTPVVSSVETSLKEIVGDAGVPVDPRNPQQIAEKVMAILQSPDLAMSLRKKGIERAKQFTRERYARSLYKLLCDINNF